MKKLLICLFSSLLLTAPISFAEETTSTQDDAQKLAEVEAAIKDLNRQLNDIKIQRSELEKQLERSESDINATMKHVADLKNQIKTKEGEVGAVSGGKKN